MFYNPLLVEDFPDSPGIYAILNKIDGKYYVGSSKSLINRIKIHRQLLRQGTHVNKKLQHAWDKHKEESFVFLLVELCDSELILNREQHWIDRTHSAKAYVGYNLVAIAKGGYSKESQVAATKAAALVTKGVPRSEEVKEAIRLGNLGKIVSEETRAKMKANHWSKRQDAAEILERSAAGHRGKEHTEEHKAKISKSLLARSNKDDLT